MYVYVLQNYLSYSLCIYIYIYSWEDVAECGKPRQNVYGICGEMCVLEANDKMYGICGTVVFYKKKKHVYKTKRKGKHTHKENNDFCPDPVWKPGTHHKSQT